MVQPTATYLMVVLLTSATRCIDQQIFQTTLEGCWTNFIHSSVHDAADKTAKIKTASQKNWVVSAQQKMKYRKKLITKSFQASGIIFSDTAVVCSDDTPKRAMEAVQRELSLSCEDENEEFTNDFADIDLED